MATWDINHQRKRHVHVHRQPLLTYEMEGKTSVPTPLKLSHSSAFVTSNFTNTASSPSSPANALPPRIDKEGILSKRNLQKLAKRDTFYNMVMLIYK